MSSTNHPFADGFLSAAVREVRGEVHKMYPSHVELAYHTNRCAVSLQHELNIHVDRPEETLGAALYARTLAFTQSSAILLEHGLTAQARTVLRAALETLFQLAALAKDHSLADKILNSHEADRRTLADRIRRWNDPALRAAIDLEISEADLLAMAGGTGKPINIYELAKFADLEDWYLSLYTLLSFAAHSKVSDLGCHIVLDDTGEQVEFQNEPDTSNQGLVWSWGIEVLLMAMKSVGAIFSLDVRMLETIRERLRKLSGQGDVA